MLHAGKDEDSQDQSCPLKHVLLDERRVVLGGSLTQVTQMRNLNLAISFSWFIAGLRQHERQRTSPGQNYQFRLPCETKP